MKLTVKDLNIATGGILVAILDQNDAHKMDLHPNDRILLRAHGKKTVAIVDIALSHKTVKEGEIGLMEEVVDKLNSKQGSLVTVDYAKKPESLQYIKKKLEGGRPGSITTTPSILPLTTP